VCEKLRSRCSRAGVKVSTLRAAYELGESHVHDLLRNHNVPWDSEADVTAAAEAVESANGSHALGSRNTHVHVHGAATSRTPSHAAAAPLATGRLLMPLPSGTDGTLAAGGTAVGAQRVLDGTNMQAFGDPSPALTPSAGRDATALPLLDSKVEFKPDHAQMVNNYMHEALDAAGCMSSMPGFDDIEPMHANGMSLSSQAHLQLHSRPHMHDSFVVGMGGSARDLAQHATHTSLDSMLAAAVCVTCGELLSQHGGRAQGFGQECRGCARLRDRGIALGLDHTTITTRVRIAGRSTFEREMAHSEAQHMQHSQQQQQQIHAQQWGHVHGVSLEIAATSVQQQCCERNTSGRLLSGELDGGVGVSGRARKPQRGRVCLVCQEMKVLSDFRVVDASALPKEICGECVRVCDAVTGVGIAWQEVRQAMADGTLHGLLEAAGCM
jgi:hypothetical protein